MRLKGKVAVITGAGQTPGENIGRAAAFLFAREGARLVLANRSMHPWGSAANFPIRLRRVRAGLYDQPDERH
jgi:NAD(P)-dependent dehydrogenase (short-subunit alcohol dehydrogenase family)